MKILLLIFVFGILPTDSFKITSLLSCLETSKKVILSTIKGKFEYTKSDAEQDIYTSLFKSDSLDILYTLHGDSNVKDTFSIGNDFIPIENKYDPLTIEVAKINFNKECYICLLGKSVSASGSGVQVAIYTLLKLKGNKIVQTYFFQSRFGSFLNIGDFNSDNELDYVKVVNGDEHNKYIAKLYSVKTNSLIGKSNLLLTYNGNDSFSLEKDNWFNKVYLDCIKSTK